MEKIDYFRAYLEYKTSKKSKINPYKLYYIGPGEINKVSKLQSLRPSRLSPVVGGDWDREYSKLKDYDIVYSLKNHFKYGGNWSETDFYSRAKECIDEETDWQGRRELNSIEQLEHYLDKIDNLYNLIKSNGYENQRNIPNNDSYHIPTLLAYERHEVTVNVARDGEFMLEDGWHRLAIAKALNLDEIPVRIKADTKNGGRNGKKL